jgi:hypothetical protein
MLTMQSAHISRITVQLAGEYDAKSSYNHAYYIQYFLSCPRCGLLGQDQLSPRPRHAQVASSSAIRVGLPYSREACDEISVSHFSPDVTSGC